MIFVCYDYELLIMNLMSMNHLIMNLWLWTYVTNFWYWSIAIDPSVIESLLLDLCYWTSVIEPLLLNPWYWTIVMNLWIVTYWYWTSDYDDWYILLHCGPLFDPSDLYPRQILLTSHGGSMTVSLMHQWHDSSVYEWWYTPSPLWYDMIMSSRYVYDLATMICSGGRMDAS